MLAVATLETPAVTVDLDIMEDNIRRIQSHVSRYGIAFRPHIETHKIPALGRLQMQAGAVGITCQKIGEVEVFADAIARAGSLDKDKVRDALAKTDLMTFYGPVKFDETGKNIAKSMVMYQVQNEHYVVVAPSKWASAKPVYPAPAWDKREAGDKVSIRK